MSKTISVALKAHYAQENTTIARCWLFTRTDGLVVAVTSCDQNLVINGVTYLAAYGVNATAIAQEATGAVANSEVTGYLSNLVTEADLMNGKWDACLISVFEVNYMNLSQGQMILQTGSVGNVQSGRVTFMNELRGITQSLQNTVGVLYTQLCTATLGDARCKVSLAAYTVTGTVTSVTDLATFVDTSRNDAQDYYTYGLITFNSGLNAGLSMEVQQFNAGGQFKLCLPMPYTVAVGDTYTVIAGCNKTLIGNMARTGAITFPNFGGYIQYDATRTEPAGFYIGGSIQWTSGANSGTGQTILDNTPGQLVLATAPANPSVVGDQYVIAPPNNQLYTGDCKLKFNNVVNFRGFPVVPGADLILGLGGTTGSIQ